MTATARKRPTRQHPRPPRMVVASESLERPPLSIAFDRPVTIAEAIRRQRLTFRYPTVAVVVPPESARRLEPRPVMRRDWTRRKLRRGETLIFVRVPRGESGRSFLALIASVALSVVAGPLGTAIAGALFAGSAVAAALITTGIVVAGSFLINALLPTPKQAEAERVNLASASSNRALPLGTIPWAGGEMRFPPPLAALPYAEFENNDQILYQLHCASLGKWAPSKWEIGKTLAWTAADGFTAAFSGIDIQIIYPGDDITLFPANVVVSENVAGQTVPDPPERLGPFAVNAAGTEISEIAVDFVFPGGLYTRGSGGSASNASRQLQVRYRPIDSSGNPIGPGTWTNLINETITRKTATPQRMTRKATVTPGRYEVDFAALNADTTDAGTTINRVAWAGLRGYLTDWETPAGVTLIATRIRVNDQLSQQSANEYFFTGTRHLPTYDSEDEEWDPPAETRSIAWAAADILRNSDYGGGLSDDQFDLGWLAAYDTVWAERGDRFDGVFDSAQPLRDVLDSVLRCGRAYHVRLGGRIGFVRDEPKTVRRHVFGPWNTLRGSHARVDEWLDEEKPDSVRARYLDRTVWTDRELTASISAIGAALPEPRQYFGITDRDHVGREAIYDAAANAYRRSFRSFRVEHEGRQLVRGDPVLYHDPLMEESAAARLVNRDGDTFTIDRDFTPADGETYHLVIADKRGKEWGPVAIDSFPDARTIVLDSTDRATVEGQHGELDDILPGERSEQARLSILAGEYRMFSGLLVSARPSGPLWEVVLVNDDPRVHTADETETIPAPYTPPPLYSPPPEAPSITGIYALARRGTLHIELEAGWQPSSGAQRYVAEISYDDDAQSSPGGASWTPVHDGVGTRFTAVILPQPWTLRVAAIGVRQGLWFYVTGTSPEPALAPGTVTQESLSAAIAAVMAWAQGRVPQEINDLRQLLEQLSASTTSHFAAIREEAARLALSVGDADGANAAAAELAAEAAADAEGAVAALLGTLIATTAAGEATTLVRFQAVSTGALPFGVVASVAIELKAEADGEYAFTGFYLDAVAGGGSRIRAVTDSFLFQDPSGLVSFDAFDLTRGGDTPEPAPIVDGVIQVDLSTGRDIFETFVDQSAVILAPIGARDGKSYTHRLKMDGTGGHTVIPNEGVMFGADPTINDSANVLNLIGFHVVRIPAKLAVVWEKAALEDDPGPLVFEDSFLGGTGAGTLAFIPCGDSGVGGEPGFAMAVMSARWAITSSTFGSPPNPNTTIEQPSGWERILDQVAIRQTSSGTGSGVQVAKRALRVVLDIKRLDGSEIAPLFPYHRAGLILSGGGPLSLHSASQLAHATSAISARSILSSGAAPPLAILAVAGSRAASPLSWSAASPTPDDTLARTFLTSESTDVQVMLSYKLLTSPEDASYTANGFNILNMAGVAAVSASPF